MNFEFIKQEIGSFYGFIPSDQIIKEFIGKYPDIKTFDTSERELFINFIAIKITGFPFPTNGDSEKHKKKFYYEFNKNKHNLYPKNE